MEKDAKTGFRVQIKDLENLVKKLRKKMGHTPYPDTFLIDAIANRQDQQEVVGPRLTIIANDAKDFTWGIFDDINLEAELKAEGWDKCGESCERGRVMHKGKPLVTYYRHRDEAYLSKPLGPRSVEAQFWIMRKFMGSRIEVIHCDIEYIMHNQGKPAGVAGMIWKIMNACPSIMAMALSYTDEDKAIDFVHKYLFDRHGIMLTIRNVDEVIRLENKGGKAPVRKVMKPKAKIRKKDMAEEAKT